MTLSSCIPITCSGNACFGWGGGGGGASEFKVSNLINLCALALWLALHIFATQC